MQIVYQAAHSANAQLVRGLLEHEGIRAFVFGGALEGGAGLLPAAGMVRVEVADEDAARARAAIERWQATELPPDDDDGNRDADGANAGGDDSRPDRSAEARKPGRSGFGRGDIVFALLAGAMIGAVVTGAVLHRGQQSHPQDYAYDYDHDGVVDERMVFRGQRPLRLEADRNGDGSADAVTSFDRDGLPVASEEDLDFDGAREIVYRYHKRQAVTGSADYDGDGVPDWRHRFRHGVIADVEWLDRQGRVVKRDRYTGGRLSDGEIDSDGDGVLDTSRVYDAHGEVRSSAPLSAR